MTTDDKVFLADFMDLGVQMRNSNDLVVIEDFISGQYIRPDDWRLNLRTIRYGLKLVSDRLDHRLYESDCVRALQLLTDAYKSRL